MNGESYAGKWRPRNPRTATSWSPTGTKTATRCDFAGADQEKARARGPESERREGQGFDSPMPVACWLTDFETASSLPALSKLMLTEDAFTSVPPANIPTMGMNVEALT